MWIDEDTRELLMSEDFDLTGEEMETFWNEYLCDPEYEVLEELEIATEPSGQGTYATMYLVDDSGEGRFESIGVDWYEWSNTEVDMAFESATAEEYKNKFKAYIIDLCEL